MPKMQKSVKKVFNEKSKYQNTIDVEAEEAIGDLAEIVCNIIIKELHKITEEKV